MRTCQITGCDRPHRARGWCDAHYGRWVSHGDPGPAKILDYQERVAARVAAQRARTDARLEDLQWLLDSGVPVQDAIDRLDWTLDGATIAARRRGLPDLRRTIGRVRARVRRAG